MANWLLLLLLAVPAYAQTVFLAGVELRLGMPKDAVLATFATSPNVKVAPGGLKPDVYFVSSKDQTDWDPAGDLVFESGKLTRIGVYTGSNSRDESGSTLAKAIY